MKTTITKDEYQAIIKNYKIAKKKLKDVENRAIEMAKILGIDNINSNEGEMVWDMTWNDFKNIDETLSYLNIDIGK